MIRKSILLVELLAVQAVMVVLAVMFLAEEGSPNRIAWLNDAGLRARSMISNTSRAGAEKVSGLFEAAVPDFSSEVGAKPRPGEILIATGYGAMPENAANIAQAQLMAVDAAQLDAQRGLAARMAGVKLDSKRGADRHVLSDYSISETMEAHLAGAELIATRFREDGSVEVDMQVTMPED